MSGKGVNQTVTLQAGKQKNTKELNDAIKHSRAKSGDNCGTPF